MKKIGFTVLFLLVSGFLFAGGQKSSTPRVGLDELAAMPWEQVVEVAKGEGEVNWFVYHLQSRFREIAQDFTDKYGIKVIIPDGTIDGNRNKAIAERNLDVGSIDVLAVGADTWFVLEKAKMAFGPLNFLPNYSDKVEKIAGVDTDGYALAYWGNQTGFAYDSARINENELPQTLEELTAWIRQNPHEFGFADVRGGGSGQAFLASVLNQLDRSGVDYQTKVTAYREAHQGEEQPPDFFKENPVPEWPELWNWLNQNKPYYTVTKNNADSLTRLNDGEFRIVAAWEDHLHSLQTQGAISRKLKFYVPKMGMQGGGNLSAVLKNAPHPASALLFIDWLTSKETQERFMKEMGTAPQNRAVQNRAVGGDFSHRNVLVDLPREYKLQLNKDFIAKVLLEQPQS